VNFLKMKIAHKPLGIWVALMVLVGFLLLPFFFSPFFFPHWNVFLQRGLFRQLIFTPGAPSLLIGIPFALKAIIGLMKRRLWGLFDAQAASALMLSLLLSLLPVYGTVVLIGLLPIFFSSLGLFMNRRWFDDHL